TRNAGVRRMAHDRSNESFGIAATAKYVGASVGMLIGGGKHLVIEVVKQSDESPFVYVIFRRAVTTGASAHSGFDRQGMFTKTVPLGVLAEQLPGFIS